jgi:hypothetical protein
MEESEKRIMERQELDRRIEVGDMEFINRFFSTDISFKKAGIISPVGNINI